MINGKSFVLSASFPESKKGEDGFRSALRAIASYDFAAVEYYCEGCKLEIVPRLAGWPIRNLPACRQAEGVWLKP